MNKPNSSIFFCVGAQKAGTTSLYDILKHHPDIYLPRTKETHFFDKEELYEKGINWWYEEFFKASNGKKWIGDFTPEYLYFEEIPERIVKDLGKDLKIIIILRNPVDRAYSHYLMSKRKGYEDLSFSEAIDQEPERIKLGYKQRDEYSYIDRGRYAKQIERYTKLFRPDQLLFLSFENDIKTNIDATMVRIQQFLDIEILQFKTDIKSNPAAETKYIWFQKIVSGKNILKSLLKPFFSRASRRMLKKKLARLNSRPIQDSEKLTSEEKEHLFLKYYANEINHLKNLTGIDFSYWIENKEHI